MNVELLKKLESNATFYERESDALLADEARRDRRHLGGREAAMIAELLREAANALKEIK